MPARAWGFKSPLRHSCRIRLAGRRARTVGLVKSRACNQRAIARSFSGRFGPPRRLARRHSRPLGEMPLGVLRWPGRARVWRAGIAVALHRLRRTSRRGRSLRHRTRRIARSTRPVPWPCSRLRVRVRATAVGSGCALVGTSGNDDNWIRSCCRPEKRDRNGIRRPLRGYWC